MKKYKLYLMGLLCITTIFISFNVLGYEETDIITVNTVSYYLDGYDLVFSIDLQSTLAYSEVNFTLNSIDEHVSIADCPNLNWKNNITSH